MKSISNISIIIIGLNEARFLPKCLESVVAMVDSTNFINDYEILYIDSGSSDESVDIALEYGCKVFMLTGDKSAAAGRQTGVLESKHDALLFLDGDMEVDKEFLSHVQEYLHVNTTDDIAGFIGQRDDVLYTQESKVKKHIKNYYNSFRPKYVNHMGGGALLFRSAISSTSSGGYEPDQKQSEEPLLLVELLSQGWQVADIAKPFITHHNAKSLSLKQKIINLMKPYGGSYYFGILFAKLVKRGNFYSLARMFPLTLTVWTMVFFLVFGFLWWPLVVVAILMASFLLVKKPKILFTGVARLFGVLYYLFLPKKNFSFKYEKWKN